MEYRGKYEIFNSSPIKTYPLSQRSNKVKSGDMVDPGIRREAETEIENEIEQSIAKVADAVVSARSNGYPVIVFTGAHLIKNGLGGFIIELIKSNCITLVAGNGATAIHDFELALIGETSENVPSALSDGRFGMAYEFSYINTALSIGNRQKLGYGESLGKFICDLPFQQKILSGIAQDDSPREFSHPEFSILAACYQNNVPFTVHIGIGTDVIDQHPSFDGEAKGGCSGRDFLIFTNEVSKLSNGGVVLNIGSAVTGPEVLLKSISMSANTGSGPQNLVTADFDLRSGCMEQMSDENSPGYYFRDQKSVVTRIPGTFNGKGYYIQGNQKFTLPLLYRKIREKL